MLEWFTPQGIYYSCGAFVGAEEGAWVRVKIGPYSGDLGKVVSVDYNADTARVKVRSPHAVFEMPLSCC